ncbi:hypothetical protein QYM36_000292 [Artemia franciscana]|uniref:Uncharacterized protein n=1 Tax=Artemia franciscana TaxID=6661 RepID=A0AA88I7S3_ARTSF|nr:hypothetical protein QYM36_000292 [Artemia franciscana]
MASGIDAANQNDDEILCPIGKQKSVSMLLVLLKEVFGNVKKVPGGKDNVKEICDRILVLHQNVIEENSELLRKENRHLQTIVKLQERIGDLNKTPISMLGVAQPTVTSSRSFASAVRGQNVYSVILKPVEYDKNSDKRLGRNDLQKLTKSFYQAIDKDSKNFAVKKTVPAKNGKIIFELGSESDAEEAISAFNKKVEVTKYKAVQVKKKMPRIIVYDVTKCEDADSFRTEFLRSNNDVKDMVDHGELLKVVTVLWKDRNRANVWFQKDDSVNDNMFHSDVRQQVQNFVQNVTSGVDEINADTLKDAIDSLKPMKAPGPDGILNLVLKKNINAITPSFLKIINACLNLCY